LNRNWRSWMQFVSASKLRPIHVRLRRRCATHTTSCRTRSATRPLVCWTPKASIRCDRCTTSAGSRCASEVLPASYRSPHACSRLPPQRRDRRTPPPLAVFRLPDREAFRRHRCSRSSRAGLVLVAVASFRVPRDRQAAKDEADQRCSSGGAQARTNGKESRRTAGRRALSRVHDTKWALIRTTSSFNALPGRSATTSSIRPLALSQATAFRRPMSAGSS
jgi:hypothetical protein